MRKAGRQRPTFAYRLRLAEGDDDEADPPCKTTGSGVIIATYEPAGPVRYGSFAESS
ncbi:MAG: hypothetical protein J2P27_16265 [Actinobacteria bacterium]|nr:hypothetical protein [Actinomycetota bacterium]